MAERNWARVNRLYDYLDQSSLFEPLVEKSSRSIANVTFRCPSPELDAAFVEQAAARGIVNIKGHRILGGMRASCYNAVPDEAIDALLAFMADFEAAHASA